MNEATAQKIAAISKKYGANVPGLSDEIKSKLIGISPEGRQVAKKNAKFMQRIASGVADHASLMNLTRYGAKTPPEIEERIIALIAGSRPVAKIRNNRATTEFIGPDSESWSKVIEETRARLDTVIPAVGRIELTNGDISWAGSAWLVAEDILVTNRHVASIFSRIDSQSGRFVFRTGLLSRTVSCDIDFREEEQKSDELEHPVIEVLWIAGSDEPDVAFLRIARGKGQPPLPRPIELADNLTPELTIAAIGYPAEDPTIPDQKLVRKIFGDVYELKRLAPGILTRIVNETRLEHDCSTLGGNSGSVLIDVLTGRAVGLHHGGYLDDSANLAVPAGYLRQLLNRALKSARKVSRNLDISPKKGHIIPENINTCGNTQTFTFNVPIEITIKVGGCVAASVRGSGVAEPSSLDSPLTFDQAVAEAHRRFSSDPDVLSIRAGYRFKNGWITDERAIVIELKQKLPYGDLAATGRSPFPPEIGGIGVDIRTAPLPDQLENLGIDLIALERPSRMAGYKEPPGFDDPDSPFALKRVKAPMDAVFHVSPDSGFPNLRNFFGRVTQQLTATMYEWTPNHISDAIESAISPNGRKLKMVTQKRELLKAMRRRLPWTT